MMRNPESDSPQKKDELSPFHYRALQERLAQLTDPQAIRRELDRAYGDSISKKIECLISLSSQGEDIQVLLKMLEFDLAEKPPLYEDVSRTDYLEDDLCVATEELLTKLIEKRVEINRKSS